MGLNIKMPPKIIVCCPHFVTGGPELLHQLVRQLIDIGHEAYISYMPFGPAYETPGPYEKYEIPQSELVDESGVLVIVPEPFTIVLKQLKKAQAIVWWLSVDNYYYFSGDYPWRNLRARIGNALRGRISLRQMRRYRHLAQSQYALEFLKEKSLSADYLSDYLSESHLMNRAKEKEKENIIVFNPKKGFRRTRKLIDDNPQFKFVPLQNLSAAGVAELLERAKIYIDFGHHPGKDRAPREAVMAGCCVITGRRGAARYREDVPVPDSYKLDDRSGSYLSQFPSLAASILANYELHFAHFQDYRQMVIQEPHRFALDVRRIFDR